MQGQAQAGTKGEALSLSASDKASYSSSHGNIQVTQLCRSRAQLDPSGQAPWMGWEVAAEHVDALRAGSDTYWNTSIHAFIQQSGIPY